MQEYAPKPRKKPLLSPEAQSSLLPPSTRARLAASQAAAQARSPATPPPPSAPSPKQPSKVAPYLPTSPPKAASTLPIPPPHIPSKQAHPISAPAPFSRSATVLAAEHHPIDNEKIAPKALFVLNRLIAFGHDAYLVGGSVRDLLLGRTPRDFDIATDATPNQIMRLFANCRIIGRRFRIAHIYFREGSPLEVTTFRKDPRKPRKNHYYATDDNEFGTAEQDAWRRDLTINGLFYDHTSQQIIDHVGGLRDLRDGIIRIIGDPKERFHEDPVRILRAIRHASRVGFTIEPQSLSEIQRCAHLLKLCSAARILEEFLRELRGGNAFQALQLMLKTNVLREWQPFVYHWLKQPNSPQGIALCETLQSPALTPQWGHQAAFWSHLQALDQYAQNDLVLPDEFLLIAFFLPFWWRSAFALAARFHKKPQLLWRDAFFQSVDPYLAGLQLSHSRRERFYDIMADYWRIPTLANQPILPRSLVHSPSFPAYVELYRLELLAHDIPPPAWLEEQKPQPLEGIPAFQWVDF